MIDLGHYDRSGSVQFSCSVVSDFVTPWIAARQASLSITNSWIGLVSLSKKKKKKEVPGIAFSLSLPTTPHFFFFFWYAQ